MEKIQEYFQNQISELLKEVEKCKKSKIKTTQFEDTIIILQKRLNDRITENENTKDTLEQFYKAREDDAQLKFSQIEKALQETILNGQKMANQFENLKIKFNHEKQTEVQKVSYEKDTVISQLTSEKEFLNRQAKSSEKDRDEKIRDMKLEVDIVKTNSIRQVQTLQEEFLRQIQETSQKHEGIFHQMKHVHRGEVEKQQRDYEKKNEDANNFFNKITTQLKEEAVTEIQKLKEQNAKLLTEKSQSDQSREKEIYSKAEEVRSTFEKKIEIIQNQSRGKISEKEEELKKLEARDSKILTDMHKIKENLEAQVIFLIEELKVERENHEMDNANYELILKKDKDDIVSKLHIRDKKIADLTKTLEQECGDLCYKIESLEKKNKIVTDDLTDISAKYTNYKEKYLNVESISIQQKTELLKATDISNRLSSKIGQLTTDLDLRETANRKLTENFQKKEEDSVKFRSECTRLVQCELRLKEELKRTGQELDEKNKENSQYATMIQTEKIRVNQSQKHIDQYQLDIQNLKKQISAIDLVVKTQKSDLIKKAGEISDFKNDLNINKAHNTANTKSLIDSHETMKHREIADLNNTITQLSSRLNTMSQIQDTLKSNIIVCNQTIADRDEELVKKDREFRNTEQYGNAMKATIIEKEKEIRNIIEIKDRTIADTEIFKRSENAKNETLEKENKDFKYEIEKVREIMLVNTRAHDKEINKMIQQRKEMMETINTLNKDCANLKNESNALTNQYNERIKMMQNELNNNTKQASKYSEQLIISENLVNRLNSQLTHLEDEYKKENARLLNEVKKEQALSNTYVNTITEVRKEFLATEDKVKMIKADCIEQLSRMRKEHSEHSEKMQKEAIVQQETLEAIKRRLNNVTQEFEEQQNLIRVRLEAIQNKESDLKKLENDIRNEPPRVLDPTLQFALNNAEAQARLFKIEIHKTKENMHKLNQQIDTLKGTISLLETQNDRLQQSCNDFRAKEKNETKI